MMVLYLLKADLRASMPQRAFAYRDVGMAQHFQQHAMGDTAWRQYTMQECYTAEVT